MAFGKKKWRNVHEYLLQLRACQSMDQFMDAACLEVNSLIPFDASAEIFRVGDLQHLGGMSSPEVAFSYNSYYRYRIPSFGENSVLVSEIVDWRDRETSEFAVDFMRPNGCWKSLNHHPVPGQQIFLSINRSRSSSTFRESDIDTLGLVEAYLNNLYLSLDAIRNGDQPTHSVGAIAGRFPDLSRREAEVCLLVSRRLTTAEMGNSLFVSRRTVEKHLENIFDKLHVDSREQLRRRLATT